MSYSELYINPDFMRSGNEKDLSPDDYDDELLKNISRTAALEDLKQDLLNALALKEDSYGLAQLDNVAATYTVTLQKALAYRQLYRFYLGRWAGDGTLADKKMRIFEQNYEQIKSSFSKLVTESNRPATVMQIKRG